MQIVVVVMRTLFLSTLSLRRATANAVDQILPGHISIHALLAESDADTGKHLKVIKIFLSTLSLRRATARRVLGFVDPDISIHALLAESDYLLSVVAWKSSDFYPRSPCGERL